MDAWMDGRWFKGRFLPSHCAAYEKTETASHFLCISGVRKMLRSPGIAKCQVKCYCHAEHSSVSGLMRLV